MSIVVGRKRSLVATLALLSAAGWLAASAIAAAQKDSARALYQQAIHEEQALGNVTGAMTLYERVVATSSDRELTARAELRLAGLYEKLGRMEEARARHEKIVARYQGDPALAEIVKVARAALGATPRPPGTAAGSPVARRIWTGEKVDAMGSVSGDGRYLSFTDWETGDLAIRDLRDGTTRRLTNTGGWAASGDYAELSIVSPDGRQVAYAWHVEKTLAYELRVISTARGEVTKPRVVHRNDETGWVAPHGFTPDGKNLVATRTLKDFTNQIALMSLEDGSVRVLKSLDWRDPEARLSPDGRYIAYDMSAGDNEPARDIYLLAADGSRETVLVENPANDRVATWSPDGSLLLFLSDRTGSDALYGIRIQDGKPAGSAELLKTDLNRIRPLGMTRTGDLYYFSGGFGRNAYVAELDREMKVVNAPTLVTERYVNANGGASWSPDGQRLAYYSFRGPRVDTRSATVLVIRTLQTGEEREIPLRSLVFPVFSRVTPKWFPDGGSVLVVSREPSRRRFIYSRFDVATGNGEVVHHTTGLGITNATPQISADGRAIFYTGGDDDDGSLDVSRTATKLMKLDLQSRRSSEVRRAAPQQFFMSFAISPDGAQLAYLLSDQSTRGTSLEVIPSGGGNPRHVFGATPWLDESRLGGIAWAPDQRYLLFVKGEDGQSGPKFIWRVPVAGGAAEKTGISGQSPMGALHLSPDGRRLAFETGANVPREVWVLESFLPKPSTSR